MLDQAKMNEWVGEQAEQRDLRIHEEFSRTHVQPLGKGEPALQPCPGSPRSTLKLIDLPMHGARGRQKHRIVRRRSKRFGAIGHRERLGIFGAQAKHEPESVQQATSHRMLRSVSSSSEYARWSALFASLPAPSTRVAARP